MPTGKQDNAFITEVIPQNLLDAAIEWISKNLEPDDVFLNKKLDDWATSSGYKKDE